ncbi:TPA: S-formylglutathione hydrolase [Photobacterium damselae]
MTLENISCNKSAGGWHKQYTHHSEVLSCDMRFAIFLPPQTATGKKVPVLYWLSGLTCTDENFMQKAGAQRIAAELGIAIVAPDTSPRGENVPDDENGTYDFGLGAGFYVNATQAPWDRHYRMYDYVVNELPAIIEANFPVTEQRAISGHSMGGHGALMISLRNPERFSSVSAFSPIANPINCPWGQKAFNGYLGDNPKEWKNYDSSELMRLAEKKLPTLVDQGTQDNFYIDGQLRPESLVAAAEANDYPLELRMQDGYDHSYYFMASFIEDHLRFHMKHFG